MTSPTVVFDLDGTLVDTAPDLVNTLNVILRREGLPPVGYEAARNMVGGGARRMIERGLAAEGVLFPPQKIDALFRDFIEHYSAHIADQSRIFPELEPAIDALSARGCRFAVCTNKLEFLSVRLLDLLGLSSRFVAICGADTFAVQKPNPEILRRTIERAGGRPEHAVMIGDSATDISTARAARVPVIAVDFGYTDVPVATLRPDRVISRFRDLPAAVFDLLTAKFEGQPDHR
jgi:phosphoglycolate phosphatase